MGAVFHLLSTSPSGEQINEDLEFVLNSSESLTGGEILLQQCDSGFAFLSVWGSTVGVLVWNYLVICKTFLAN